MACSQTVLRMPFPGCEHGTSTWAFIHGIKQTMHGGHAQHCAIASAFVRWTTATSTQLNSRRIQSAVSFLQRAFTSEASHAHEGGAVSWSEARVLAKPSLGSFHFPGRRSRVVRQGWRSFHSKLGERSLDSIFSGSPCGHGTVPSTSSWQLSSSSYSGGCCLSRSSSLQLAAAPTLTVWGCSQLRRSDSPVLSWRGIDVGSRCASTWDLDALRKMSMEFFKEQDERRRPPQHGGGDRAERSHRNRTKCRGTRRPMTILDEADCGPGTGGLRRGTLVEFKRDGKEPSLGVAKRPDGKKNWIITDQYGNESAVRPAQIAYIVRDADRVYTAAEISRFESKAGAMQDPSLLEPAWEEVVTDGRAVSDIELSELLFNSSGPLESYASHRMLTLDRVYFKNLNGLFKPNSPNQVAELKQQVLVETAAAKVLSEFVERVRAAVSTPPGEKPAPTSWDESGNKRERAWMEAIRSVAIDVPERFPTNEFIAQEVFRALRVNRTPEKARDLLIGMGVWPRHVNLQLMRSPFSEPFTPAAQAAAMAVETDEPPPVDIDAARRVDFSAHKIFTVDSEDTVEIDDGLSIERTSDGRRLVWIHVADPARWVQPGDVIDLEAQRRCTSVYLPTGPVTMFPAALASGRMSLVRGRTNCAMSVGVTLSQNSEIDNVRIVNSYVCPTYRLTFEETNEILSWGMASEKEILELMEVADARYHLRMSKGAVNICIPKPKMQVRNPDEEEPDIQAGIASCDFSPARRLVEELMILCGEAVAMFGAQYRLPLPYRGQAQSPLPDTSGLPPGPCTAALLRTCMGRSETNCESPIAHAALGLGGYVQFTSPIRRYGDLIAHFCVKGFLRGEPSPFTPGDIQRFMSVARFYNEEARRLEQACQRYWICEFLRQHRQRAFKALVLRWIRPGSHAQVLLNEFGLEIQMTLVSRCELGDEIDVVVTDVHPHNGILAIAEAPLSMTDSSSPFNDLPSGFVHHGL